MSRAGEARVSTQLTPLLIAASTPRWATAGSPLLSIENASQPIAWAAFLADWNRYWQTTSESGQGMTATVAPLIGGGDDSAPLHTTPPCSSGARDILPARPASTTFFA